MPGILPPSVLWALLQPLASLLLPACKGDKQEAFEAATDTAMAYNPKTPDELRDIVRLAIMDIEINQTYAQASTPGLTFLQAGRLRSIATAMVREAGKVERHLEGLRLRRRKAEALAPKQQAEPAPEAAAAPEADAAPDQPAASTTPIQTTIGETTIGETTGIETEMPAGEGGALTWTHPYKQRKHERRLAALRERTARIVALAQATNLTGTA